MSLLRLGAEQGHQPEHSLLLVPDHRFGHRTRARALAPEVVLGGPCPGTVTNLNVFSSVPAVFTFSQAVEAPTANLQLMTVKTFSSMLMNIFSSGH